jgi:AraC family transcriptional regulator
MQSLKPPDTKQVSSSPSELQPPLISSQAYNWQHLLVEEFCQPPGQETYQSAMEHMLCVSLNSRPARLFQAIDTDRHTSLFSKGDLSITPAGARFFCQWDQDDQYLRIRIASEFLQQVAESTLETGSARIELLSEFRARNPQIEQIGMMLLSELKHGGPAGSLYVASLTNLLAVQLLRDYSAVQPCIVSYEGGLSEYQRLKITDYIHDRLSENIQLTDLADLIGLSQFHFSRLFKRSMGVSPYQYVLQQRIERAKQLLKQTELSIMDIALLCGFSSHSHLGKWFRQSVGVTPKAFRLS